MESKRVLILYHSLTGRTAEVVTRIDAALRDGGHVTDRHRMMAAEPWEFPISRTRFLWRNAQCWAGMDMNMPILPLDLGEGPWDHVVLGTQTWHLNPAFPVLAFLDSDEAEVLRGKIVTPVITCRNRWRSCLEILTRKLLQRGARVAGAYVLSDPPQHLMPTLFYLFNGHDPTPGSFFEERSGRPFHFAEEDLATADAFGAQLARQLGEGEITIPGEPTVVHDQEG